MIRRVDAHRAESWVLINKAFPIPRYANSFFQSISPVGFEYHSPLNPIFLVQVPRLQDLNSRPHWVIRDGEIPLYYFFLTHPKPVNVQSKIYIDARLSSLVPKAWHSVVGSYELAVKAPRRKVKKLLLCGVGDGHHTVEDLEEQLADLGLQRMKSWEKYAYLPMRFNQGYDETSVLRYTMTLAKAFDNDIQALTWPQIQFRTNLEGYELVELASKRFVADSFFSHMLLSRGASMQLNVSLEKGRYVALSPYHGMILSEKISLKAPAVELLPEALNMFPWRSWFMSWTSIS